MMGYNGTNKDSVLSLIDSTFDNGGGTLWLLGEYTPSKGYVVALNGHEMKLHLPTRDELEAHIAYQVYQAIHHPRAGGVGTWVDGDYVYIDLVEYIYDKSVAVYVGKLEKQIAIYELHTGEVIRL